MGDYLSGSASTEVPGAAGGDQEKTHQRVEEQRHGPSRPGKHHFLRFSAPHISYIFCFSHLFEFSTFHISHIFSFSPFLHFLRLRKGDGTLRSRSRNEGKQSWLETRRESRGWKHRGGAAEATSSLLSEAPLRDSSSPGWTQPRGIGEAGGEIFSIRSFSSFKGLSSCL